MSHAATRYCDLVMKGGITSGIVYPNAVLALARDFRFKNIGGTSAGAIAAYAREAQGTHINPAAKRLLLGHAFACGALRVQFQIDERNQRSQAAVLKLGATREGTLRQHKVIASGFVRNTCFFSILKSEWPSVKAGLDARLPASA